MEKAVRQWFVGGSVLARGWLRLAAGGWPFFCYRKDSIAVGPPEGRRHGMFRTEVRCAECGSRLGYDFEGDGYPTPTGQSYCINSALLRSTSDEAGEQR
ncbi:peptide-methionine (R)-S-oxide reductase [Streptomyces sp. NPDC093097]|uniref:peptide-methionine (R)-S-oxide reductase n=1 Tax=Streptomyces sp. NPDC093097 TaxID=3366027 RepID=UPI003805CDC8